MSCTKLFLASAFPCSASAGASCVLSSEKNSKEIALISESGLNESGIFSIFSTGRVRKCWYSVCKSVTSEWKSNCNCASLGELPGERDHDHNAGNAQWCVTYICTNFCYHCDNRHDSTCQQCCNCERIYPNCASSGTLSFVLPYHRTNSLGNIQVTKKCADNFHRIVAINCKAIDETSKKRRTSGKKIWNLMTGGGIGRLKGSRSLQTASVLKTYPVCQENFCVTFLLWAV